ncbi:MAG: DUF898 family protein [Pseudomonadota bacterium]
MAVLKTRFGGDRGALFLLALKTGFLTLVTAGIYRFWATTRLRRWYWSSVRPGGAPLEYTGTALEKLAGFLLALILLAFVLTAINFAGIAVSISAMEQNSWAFFGAVAGVPLAILPLIFFARYRARRYILARTCWRGIRFGMTPGAWGYAWRATMYLFLTLATGGLLWPLMTFRLEKYLTDRTWYGNARFSQHGSAMRLFGPLLPFIACLWGGGGLLTYFAMTAVDFSATVPAINPRAPAWPLFAGMALLSLTFLFALYYRVASVRVLVALKDLGDGIEFDLWPRTRRIVWIYFWGYVRTYFATGFAYNVVFGFVFAVAWVFGDLDASQMQGLIENPPANLLVTLAVLTFLMVTLFARVFRQAFFIYPMVQHISETLEIHQPELLGGIRQRDADSRTDAGGFAEALDAGAAF